MNNRRSKACNQLNHYLEELQRVSNLESLRPYISHEQCFLQHVDPSSSPITVEELKRLARAWKLDHSTKLIFYTLLDVNFYFYVKRKEIF
jgi:hypothetical protein